MKSLLRLGFYARNRIYFALCCGALSTATVVAIAPSIGFIGGMLYFVFFAIPILWGAAYLIDSHRGRMDKRSS